MTPVSELPFNVRPKSRKEKNKLASRWDAVRGRPALQGQRKG